MSGPNLIVPNGRVGEIYRLQTDNNGTVNVRVEAAPVIPPSPIFSNEIASFRFLTPGSFAALVGTNGQILSIKRNSTARFEINGQEVIAAANEARVDEDGLIIEPACTQQILDPNNLKSGNWIASNTVIDANQTDPIGGTSAFLQKSTVDGGLTAHILLQAAAISGTPDTTSVYLGFDGTCRYYSLADNGGAHVAYFDGQLGVVVSVTAGSRAEMQHMGTLNVSGLGVVELYRCSMTYPPAAGLTYAGYLSTNGTTQSFIGTGGEHVWLWRPQTETNPFATSWCLVSRAADIISTAIPQPNYEWCFEVEAVPCGPQSSHNAVGAGMGWNRNAHAPLFAVNAYTLNDSIEGYVNAGNPVISVYDNAGAEKHDTGTALASGNYYVGWRRLSFTSNGTQRPSVFIDGLECAPTVAGAGTGQMKGFPLAVMYLGATSTGIVGGFKIRSVTMLDTYVPPVPPTQAFQYAWAFDRGYVSRANCVAFLGDSNTQGNYDFTVTPYPQLIQNSVKSKQCHNYGAGSNGTQMALERLRLDVVGKFYSELVVFIGINDTNVAISPGNSITLPAQQSINNLSAIVAEALAAGVTRLLLCTLMPDGLGGTDPRRVALNAINTALRNICIANPTHLVLADTYALVDDPGNPGTMLPAYDYDGNSLHLSAAGQAAVATLIQGLL
jgi:lysophospholipase L1-like esterase